MGELAEVDGTEVWWDSAEVAPRLMSVGNQSVVALAGGVTAVGGNPAKYRKGKVDFESRFRETFVLERYRRRSVGCCCRCPGGSCRIHLDHHGAASLADRLFAVVAGLFYGFTAFYLLSRNAARAVLVLGFLGGVTVLISMKSALVLGLPTWLLCGIAGSIVGTHFRYLVDRNHAGGSERKSSSGLRVQWRSGRK